MALSSKQARYDQLCAMIDKGATTLTQNGETVTFRSLDEMLRIKKLLEAELGLGPAPTRVHYPTVLRG